MPVVDVRDGFALETVGDVEVGVSSGIWQQSISREDTSSTPLKSQKTDEKSDECVVAVEDDTEGVEVWRRGVRSG